MTKGVDNILTICYYKVTIVALAIKFERNGSKMKKALALILALVMAFSMSAMAFAEDVNVNVNINAPTEAAAEEEAAAPTEFDVFGILNIIIDLVKSHMVQFDDIESIIIRIVDLIQNLGSAVVPADVNGAVADLEAALAGAEIPGISDLIDSLKGTIKSLYAGEVATVPETTAAAPADTGSASVGVAVFAAVSVAAAAAYVCTKKKD